MLETKEYRTADKSGWGRGPWRDEPDKKQWQDEATGLPCLIVRNHSGALCGYVGVSKGHPAYERDYSDVDVDVHGGLTFAAHCQPGPQEEAICHEVTHRRALQDDDPVWWLGFDCAHAGDLAPKYNISYREVFGQGQYRTVKYVEQQCRRLAAQLKAQQA